MINFRLVGVALAAGLLSVGCSGQGSTLESDRFGTGQMLPGQYSQSDSGSRMTRQSSASDLIYVSSFYSGEVDVYTYPEGKFVGASTGLWQPAGECVDKSGDVFVVTQGSPSSEASNIYEYAHGGSVPIAVLSDPGYAVGCAVDPASGNLAVANPDDTSNPYYHDQGDVAVYARAQGQPKMYYSALFVG